MPVVMEKILIYGKLQKKDIVLIFSLITNKNTK
jgi:hypothetical protein